MWWKGSANRSYLTLAVLAGLSGCQSLDMPGSMPSLSWTDSVQPAPPTRPNVNQRPSALAENVPMETITRHNEADMQIAMGRLAERRGSLDEAMKAYQSALTRDKTRSDAHHRLAVLLDRQGKFRESAELYRKALELDPGSADVYCDMGYSLYLQRRFDEAERNYKQAIVLSPDHARSRNNLALLMARTGRTGEALAEFQKGGSRPAQAHANVAFALSLDKRWDEARRHYELALQLDPTSPVTRSRLQELTTIAARIDTATPDGSRIAAHDPAILRASATSR